MARTKVVTLLICARLLVWLGGIAVLAGLTLAQDAPPEATTQPADESPPADTPPDETPPDQPVPDVAQPATVDTSAVNNLLIKTDQGQLTADEHTQLVNGLDGLVSSSLSTSELLRLSQWSGKSLTADEKTALRVKILDRLVGTAEKASALSVADARDATVVFDVLNGPAEKGKLAVAWMAASETWKTAGPEPLVRFLTGLNLAKPDDAAAPRTALVDHVWTTYLSPQADAAKANGPDYAELAIQTHKFLSAENAKLLSKFMIARLSEPKAAAQLTIAEIKKVRQTLGSLHNQLDAADLIAAWTAGSKAWQQLGPADIGFLCDQLRPKEGLAGPRAAIAALVENARSRKLLTDPASILANDAGQWPAMARALRNYVNEAEGQDMIATVTTVFIKNPRQIEKLTPGQFADLAEMSAYYGRADQAGKVALIWLAANDLSKLSADQLSLVGTAVGFGSVSLVGAKKASVGELVWTAYLSKEDFLAKTPLAELTDFVKNVSSALTPEQKGRTASALLARFGTATGETPVLPKFSVGDTLRLAQAVALMERPQDAADLVVRWMGAGENWTQAGLYDQQVLAGILKAGNTEDSSAKAVAFAIGIYKQHLAEIKGGQAPETFTLARLASFMQTMGMTGKDKGHPEFAAALVAALKAGAKATDANEYQLLSLPLGTAEDRAALEQALAGEDGNVRLEAAKILAWVYKQYDSLANWQRALDAKLADAGLAGDKKALWLMARAYAADPHSYEHGPEAVRKYLAQALTAASSEPCKLGLLGLLTKGAMDQAIFDDGLALLAGYADKLTADESKLALQGLTDKLTKARLVFYRDTVDRMGHEIEMLEATARECEAAGNNAMRDVHLRGAAYARNKKAELAKKLADLGG